MRYCVDIDGTICTLTPDPKTYEDAEPWNDRIETINKLYDEGNHIHILLPEEWVDFVIVQMQV